MPHSIVGLLYVLCALRKRDGKANYLMPRPKHPPMSTWYVEYLASPQWKRLREKIFLKRSDPRGPVCEDCKRVRRGLTLHHLTYARVTRERQADLRILCPWCHRRAHRSHDIPYLFMIYRELTPENKAIFKRARGEPNFTYPRMRTASTPSRTRRTK